MEHDSQAGTDFGTENPDSAPMSRGKLSLGGLNEKIFSLMRPKEPKQEPIQNTQYPTAMLGNQVAAPTMPIPAKEIPDGYIVQNGLLFKKKTLAERVRDSIKYPSLKNAPAAISGLALAAFAVGAYLLYSALPTRPDLVIGIILVSVAGNILISNR